MHQRFIVSGALRLVEVRNEPEKGAVEIAVRSRSLGDVGDCAAFLTPDEALNLAAALERAAFIERRAASVGAQRAEAETGFRHMSPAQVAASGSAEFWRAFYAAKYAAKG